MEELSKTDLWLLLARSCCGPSQWSLKPNVNPWTRQEARFGHEITHRQLGWVPGGIGWWLGLEGLAVFLVGELEDWICGCMVPSTA